MSATTIPQLAKTVQHMLITEAERFARPTGFVRRESKLTGALFVQTLVFSFLGHAHPHWDQLAQTAAALGLTITPSGLWQRCTADAAEFLQHVLGAALAASTQIQADPVAVPILQRFTDIVLHDATQVLLPAALAELWPGSRDEFPVLKLQTRLSYSTGALQIALCAGRVHDHALPAAQRVYTRGSLRLADLSYFALADLAALDAAGVFWLTHAKHNTAVYTADGQRWTLLELAQAQRAQAERPEGLDVPISLGCAQRLPCRLLIKRVPRRVATELIRRLHAQAREEGTVVSATQVELLRWVIFVTNVPAAQLSLPEALVVARVRWQIELLFKLWKSHGAIDESQSGKPYVVLCEVYAKLLAMLVLHWTLIVGVWTDPARSLFKAAQVVRDFARALALNFTGRAALRRTLQRLMACLGVGCRITKRKDDLATYQLLLALTEPD